MPKTPKCPDIISNPAHYTQGRTIEPIQIIEDYKLCHHLACVVKYIARAGRKTDLMRDLQKAEWYLIREIERRQKGIEPCASNLKTKPSHTIQEILDDWKLSSYLSACLSYILGSRLLRSQHRQFTWIKKKVEVNQDSSVVANSCEHLVHALNHLRFAMNEYQNKQGDKQ